MRYHRKSHTEMLFRLVAVWERAPCTATGPHGKKHLTIGFWRDAFFFLNIPYGLLGNCNKRTLILKFSWGNIPFAVSTFEVIHADVGVFQDFELLSCLRYDHTPGRQNVVEAIIVKPHPIWCRINWKCSKLLFITKYKVIFIGPSGLPFNSFLSKF